MKIHGLLLVSSVIFLYCLVFPSASTSVGSCFSSSFSRAIGFVLRGFLLGEIEVSSVIDCKRRCVMSTNCLSLNVLTNSDGSIVCQLNSEKRENGAKEQFVQHGSGEYYGLKVKNLCENHKQTCGVDSTWFAFNQSYFKLVTTKVTQDEARKVCLEEKGDLASTSSEEEQTFLFKKFLDGNVHSGDSVWIGLNDIAEEGVFVWTDGSPNTYTRFFGNDPDNYQNNEHCGVIVKPGGYLRDMACDATFTFICETKYPSL